MEQRELVCPARPKGGEVELHPGRSQATPAVLPKELGGAQPTPEKGLSIARKHFEPGEGDEFQPPRGPHRNSNPGNGKWSQGDGIEEQEFSIKEANFSEGSLKLKIQTTKRAKKPPKNLENYICPPEIRITIKQPWENKVNKQSKSSKAGKQEEKPRQKKMMDGNHLDKNEHSSQVHGTKTIAKMVSSLENRPGSELMTRISEAGNTLHDLPNLPTKSQQKKVTSIPPSGSSVSGISCQVTGTSVASMPRATHADSTAVMLSPMNKDFRGVTEQVFGNLKRKYGRKDSTRNLLNCNSDVQKGKIVKNVSEGVPSIQDSKDKGVGEPDKTKLPSGETKSAVKTTEKKMVQLAHAPLQTEESKRYSGKKQQHPVSTEGSEVTAKTNKESNAPKKFEPGTAQVVDNRKHEPKSAVKVANMTDRDADGFRKTSMGSLRRITASDKQTDAKPCKPKAKERWAAWKMKNSSYTDVPEHPSAYPITPSSPLYTNTDSLTVFTPVKKRRGRPKKQPLLTVETIHEGTLNSPISPPELPCMLKKRRKKQSLAKLVKLANANISETQQLSQLKVGELSRSASNKTKIKMKHALNEILSCRNSNLFLKSMAPMSNAISTVASTIEARLGKQINISKRGTIYIGKKRGRKPKPEIQVPKEQEKPKKKKPIDCQFENPVVPSKMWSHVQQSPKTTQSLPAQGVETGGSGRSSFLFDTETNIQELRTMVNLQSASGLLRKTSKSNNWKHSLPQLLTNSPAHLSEAVSLKEITLSPVSESHSEETIPSDSGIGTDNNSTSDQAEKGSISRRRYSFDFCSLEPSEVVALEATSKNRRGHWQKHSTGVTVETVLASENVKKQKHWRKRKGLHRCSDFQFQADFEELLGKFPLLRISHHSFNYYRENLYPGAFRIQYDHYYPVPYFPYDPLHHLRRSFDVKSKKRCGRPGKSKEPITKTPLFQGFGYPVPSGNFYAPYAMPYTSMPIATGMMNLGYYSQYPAPLYISHNIGATASPFSRPSTPAPHFHSGTHVKMTSTGKHKSRLGCHQLSSSRMESVQQLLVVPKGGIRLHKHKHKHKHKHNEDQLSTSHREDLDGLFRRVKKPACLSLISETLGMSEKEHKLPKQKVNHQNLQATDTLSKSSRNIFEANTLSTLSMSDSHRWSFLREPGQSMHDTYRHSESLQDSHSHGNNRRKRLDGFGLCMEENLPFTSSKRRIEETFNYSHPVLEGRRPPLKKRFKCAEVEEIHHEVQNVCPFSKILSTKKNMDHVNKILKAKRLQRQAKTGNNIVKKRRGRPRKQSLPTEEEPLAQMPVLEKCVDLPEKKSPDSSLGQPLGLLGEDSILHAARPKVKPQLAQTDLCWAEIREEVQTKRQRRSLGMPLLPSPQQSICMPYLSRDVKNPLFFHGNGSRKDALDAIA
ncbi:SET-binding protein-like, partial [Scleropages formosus]